MFKTSILDPDDHDLRNSFRFVISVTAWRIEVWRGGVVEASTHDGREYLGVQGVGAGEDLLHPAERGREFLGTAVAE